MNRKDSRPGTAPSCGVRSKLNAAHSASLLLETNQIQLDANYVQESPIELVQKVKSPLGVPNNRCSTVVVKKKKKSRIICEREKALIAAYMAAAELIGSAPGDMTLTPIRYQPALAIKNDQATEKALSMERALMERIVALGHQLQSWQKRFEQSHEQKQKRIQELDTKLFQARCGFDLMTTLVKEARIDTCRRAIDFMKNRIDSRDSPFIRILNDTSLLHAANSTHNLLRADSLLSRYGKMPNIYSHELPDGLYPRSYHTPNREEQDQFDDRLPLVVVGEIF